LSESTMQTEPHPTPFEVKTFVVIGPKLIVKTETKSMTKRSYFKRFQTTFVT